jgi:predicted DNA-binding transcriptional regulator AlpA
MTNTIYHSSTSQNNQYTTLDNIHIKDYHMVMEEKEVIMTLDQVSEYLKVSMHQMYKIARREDFPRLQISTWGIRVKLSQLNEWLDKQVPKSK